MPFRVGDVVEIVERHWAMEVGQKFTLIEVDEFGSLYGTPNQLMNQDNEIWTLDPRRVRLAGGDNTHTCYLVVYKLRNHRVTSTAFHDENLANVSAADLERGGYLLAKKKITVRY